MDMFPLKHNHGYNKMMVYWFLNSRSIYYLIHVRTKWINLTFAVLAISIGTLCYM
jgi:hypothetical protein